jgi:hypothetical protein
MKLFNNLKYDRYQYVSLNDIPEIIEPNKVYVVGEKRYKWVAVLVCPCGCKEIIQLNLLKLGNDSWRTIKHFDSSITIRPSIWRTVGCRSHFTIVRGWLNWYQEDSLFL